MQLKSLSVYNITEKYPTNIISVYDRYKILYTKPKRNFSVLSPVFVNRFAVNTDWCKNNFDYTELKEKKLFNIVLKKVVYLKF